MSSVISTMVTSQVALTTTAVLLVAGRAGRINLIVQFLAGASSNYVGPAGVTITTGYLLPTATRGEVSFPSFTGELWAVSSAVSGNSVAVVEFF